MTFQKKVRFDQAFGVVGELSHDGPLRAKPGVLQSANPTDNAYGRVFTLDAATGMVQAGGAGVFWGILSNPKTGMFTGRIGDSGTQSWLPNGVVGEFVDMGEIIVPVDGPASIGDALYYSTADGVITVTAPPAPPEEDGATQEGENKATEATTVAIPNAVISRVRQMGAEGGLVSLRLTN